ncbi:MAG TPA: hypothetical protein VGD21_01065 [Lysobacter sp.]
MSDQSPTTEQADAGWQRKLLPFMTRSIVVMGLLFFLSSSAQLYLMYLDLKTVSNAAQQVVPTDGNGSGAQSEESLRWAGLLALEHETLVRRHQVVNAALLHQACVLHLGFLTGMVLCLVGSVFILGRLQENASSLSGEAKEFKLALNTASPGIVLVVVGSGLIFVTLSTRIDLNVQSKAVYVSPAQRVVEEPRDPTVQRSVAKPSTPQSAPNDERPSNPPQR